MKALIVSGNIISDEGVEPLAIALTINKSLVHLNIHNDNIGDDGIAYIAKSLVINNTLKLLCVGKEREIATRPFVKFTGFTDTGALSLVSSVATNTSLECLVIQWFSTDPDRTLKKMGECVKHSSLKTLNLVIDSGIHVGRVPVSVEELQMWYQRAAAGGKELILSLENTVPLKKNFPFRF